jgi:hypothetical protein
MLSKTSIRPLHTKTTSSTRLWRATGTSFSTFGSGSKSWCRLRKMKTPASKNTITAKVNPTRSAETPAGSITAIRAELFVIMQITYGCFQPVAPTHLWDFLMPPKTRSRLSLKGEVVRQTEVLSARAVRSAFVAGGVSRRRRIADQSAKRCYCNPAD